MANGRNYSNYDLTAGLMDPIRAEFTGADNVGTGQDVLDYILDSSADVPYFADAAAASLVRAVRRASGTAEMKIRQLGSAEMCALLEEIAMTFGSTSNELPRWLNEKFG